MKILILGAYGMLGHKLMVELSRNHDVFGTCRVIRNDAAAESILPSRRLIPRVFAEDIASVRAALDTIGPDVVVNCVGIVKQLKEANEPILAIYVNALFPHKLAQICAGRARLVHFSTDCVFSGKKGGYATGDLHDATDLYGRTKSLGELNGEGCITIRSSIVGRELGSGNGLIEWFIGQRGRTVKGYTNAIYSGFTTKEMSRIVELALKTQPELSGVWQVASKPISKFDLLGIVKSKLAVQVDIVPDDTFRCDRSLDGSRFNERTGYSPPSWEAMIEEMAAESDQYESYGRS